MLIKSPCVGGIGNKQVDWNQQASRRFIAGSIDHWLRSLSLWLRCSSCFEGQRVSHGAWYINVRKVVSIQKAVASMVVLKVTQLPRGRWSAWALEDPNSWTLLRPLPHPEICPATYLSAYMYNIWVTRCMCAHVYMHRRIAHLCIFTYECTAWLNEWRVCVYIQMCISIYWSTYLHMNAYSHVTSHHRNSYHCLVVVVAPQKYGQIETTIPSEHWNIFETTNQNNN